MAAVATNNSARAAPRLFTRTRFNSPSCLDYYVISKKGIKHTPSHYSHSHSSNRMSTNARRSFHSSRHYKDKATSAIPHISLHIAAASSAKGRKYEAEKTTIDFYPNGTNALGLQAAGNLYQKRRNRPDSGEDAYFVASVGEDVNTLAMGVCDGVGGWSEQGINPSDFSHGLCSYMAEHALDFSPPASTGRESLHPKKMMHIGYDKILQDVQVRAGGATACVAVADSSGRLRTANLGDSGYIHIRLGTVHHYSNPQTHAFNTPYQMSKTPPEIMTQAAIFGGLPLNDSPDRADVADDQLQNGDVVIFATDGAWDNLSSQDILTIVSQKMREAQAWDNPQGKGIMVTDQISSAVRPDPADKSKRWTLQSAIASHIVGEAKIASHDRKRDGPFAKAVQKEYPMDRWHGGKVDDITVLVLIAVENKRVQEGELKAKL